MKLINKILIINALNVSIECLSSYNFSSKYKHTTLRKQYFLSFMA